MPEENKDGLIHLTIDDKPVAVPPGTLVWAAAKEAGIEIPIYCYHPKMPPLGACRMCFVEIEKMPKPPQTACTTPVSEGMIVHTKTEKVLKARRGTLELRPFDLVGLTEIGKFRGPAHHPVFRFLGRNGPADPDRLLRLRWSDACQDRGQSPGRQHPF